MDRQSTDLLDFFGAKGKKKSGGARARASGSREPRGAWVLGRTHLLLGAAGVVVLMLLCFVLGLSVGRKKAAPGDVPLLARADKAATAAAGRAWSIRSRILPRVGSGAETLVETAKAGFARAFPILAPHLDTQQVYDKKGKLDPSSFRLVIRGFPSREAAESWTNDLAVWAAGDFVPFAGSRPEQLGDALPTR